MKNNIGEKRKSRENRRVLTLDEETHFTDVCTVTQTRVQSSRTVISCSDGEMWIPLQVLIMRDVKSLLRPAGGLITPSHNGSKLAPFEYTRTSGVTGEGNGVMKFGRYRTITGHSGGN